MLIVAAAIPPATAQIFPSAGLDEGAVRTCRSIIAVVNPATSALDVTSTLRIGEANAIAISYVARPPAGVPRNRKIVCTFKDDGGTFRRTRTLTAVTSDGRPLGPVRMRFLQRFWLASRDADVAARQLDTPKRR